MFIFGDFFSMNRNKIYDRGSLKYHRCMKST